MSRSGPYSLMLVAALLLLLSVSPGVLGVLLSAAGLAGTNSDLVGRILLASGSLLVITSLMWVLRLTHREGLRQALVEELERVAARVDGRVDVSAGGLRRWADAGVLGLLRVDLALAAPTTMRLSLGSPGVAPLLVLRQSTGDRPPGWEPVATGAGWELRAAPGTPGRRVVEDDGAVSALDRLFSDHAALYLRHDHGGVEVEVEAVDTAALQGAIEVAFSAAARLARLNA